MGILNITPDSFSDGGQFFDPDAAVRRGLDLVQEGADIIDVGAESTRPGSEGIDADEELRRLLPVLERLEGRIRCPISVDTSKACVAEKALGRGAHIVNDIRGFQGDPDMPRVAAAHRAPAVLMHLRGTPKTMNQNTVYENLIGEVYAYLECSIERAESAGLPREYLVVDPGIGFSKGHKQNLEILHRLAEFRGLERPILVGPSRKSFIGHMLGLPPQERIFGTAAAVGIAALLGAHILRVHDVRQMRQVLDVADAIRNPASANFKTNPPIRSG